MNLFTTKNNLIRILTLPTLLLLPLAANAHTNLNDVILGVFILISLMVIGGALVIGLGISFVGKYIKYYYRNKGKNIRK